MRCYQFFSTKNTIMKKYDGRFKDIFQEIYERFVFLTFPCRAKDVNDATGNTKSSSKRRGYTTNIVSSTTWSRKP
jgi:isocitrate dehydrogenase